MLTRSWFRVGFGERGVDGKMAAIRYARRGRQAVSRHLLRHAARRDRTCAQCALTSRMRPPASFGAQTTKRPARRALVGIHGRNGRAATALERRSGRWRFRRQPCAWALIECELGKGTLAQEIYGVSHISERHRHRYEVKLGLP